MHEKYYVNIRTGVRNKYRPFCKQIRYHIYHSNNKKYWDPEYYIFGVEIKLQYDWYVWVHLQKKKIIFCPYLLLKCLLDCIFRKTYIVDMFLIFIQTLIPSVVLNDINVLLFVNAKTIISSLKVVYNIFIYLFWVNNSSTGSF